MVTKNAVPAAPFDRPFLDVDEWRDEPVRHRYVHGGFEGTDALFTMIFPPREQYQGRFFQQLPPAPGNEYNYSDINGVDVGFAFASGGYFVESNLGRKVFFLDADRAFGLLVGHQASAAVAQYSRVLAEEMYGTHRPYGYVYGMSGGSYKSVTCMEATSGVWDGAVPFVMPSPMAFTSAFSSQAHAMRVLKGKFEGIVDALDPGGSGDMYAALNAEQREALAEVTRIGFPPRAWFAHKEIAFHYTGIVSTFLDWMRKLDPTYFKDFWEVPGYLGADPPESLKGARLRHETVIHKVVKANEVGQKSMPFAMSDVDLAAVPAAFVVEGLPDADLLGASIIPTTGPAAGHSFYVVGLSGNQVAVGFGAHTFEVAASVKAGDPIVIDNSDYLAMQTYHRHDMQGADYYIYDQFRVEGAPIYPQREVESVSHRLAWAGGQVTGMTGRFDGKMIVVETLMDQSAYPWNADWYRKRVLAEKGEQSEDSFRLWFVDHGLHHAVPKAEWHSSRVINFMGAVHQALRDVAAWVEEGTAPPADSVYAVTDSQVSVPETAAERRGIQPVITLTANGGERADVSVGSEVTFSATVETPPGTGQVVQAEWDFAGDGTYGVAGEIEPADAVGTLVTVSATYAFAAPGTYFVGLRAASQRKPDGAPFALVWNLARVRVVVS